MPSAWVPAFVTLVVALVVVPSADAARLATRSQARAIWRVVDSADRCPHPRPTVSRAAPRWLWARAVISSSVCGNGEAVLRRPRKGGRWRLRASGSDWGAPHRCAEDIRRIGLAVLRDLFGPRICSLDERPASAVAVDATPLTAEGMAQPPAPGFAANLSATRVECYVLRRALHCLTYGGGDLPAGASCSFGGTVPTTRLRASGRARKSYTCVDEGFHDWNVLRLGRRFRSGPFTCSHRRSSSGRVVRCANRDRSFTIFGSGRVTRG